jgi:glutamate N-acetyltransferase/amino-acid N-acetyltransferase
MRISDFRFAGVACGIKKKTGALDLGLLASERPATAAAVFTQNQVPAAPVQLSREVIGGGGLIRAAVVNSGNANACTGARGLDDARAMQARTAAAIGCQPGEVIVASTGVIGEPLPMEALGAGIDAAAAAADDGSFDDFSKAILTTDRGPKIARRSAGGATLAGCTKGAGMIAPDMATTLTFVASDAAIDRRDLDAALRAACAESFNAITIDGDTSTNDMILVVANGAAGPVNPGVFATALAELCDELATALIRDGEGVHHVVRVEVTGARDSGEARRIARTIALSPLVKTAIAGCDPNWGRFVAAAGNAGVALEADRIGLRIDDVDVVRGGVVVPDWADAEARAAEVMKRSEYTLRLDLGLGGAAAHYLACDLSHDYVRINADYRT